jgi:hypothetical protein
METSAMTMLIRSDRWHGGFDLSRIKGLLPYWRDTVALPSVKTDVQTNP